MYKNFIIISEMEKLIKQIDKDKSIIKNLNINELEILDKYLKRKKKYLTETIGE